MEHMHIQPVSVNGHEPTCLAAFLVMAQGAALDVSPDCARQVLSMAGVAWNGIADEWGPGLERSLHVLRCGLGSYTDAR